MGSARIAGRLARMTVTANGDALIEVTNLTKRYQGRTILDGVSLVVRPGETVVLLGPSGGGKSTLLRSINALQDWDSGEIRVGEHVLTANGGGHRHATLRAVRRTVGMIFQDFQLFPHLSALDNVTLAPVHVLRLSRHAAVERARALLARFGLAERMNYYPHQLSGGQKQRVAIARAVAMSPKGLLCDEITSALDPELKQEVFEALCDLRQEGLSLVLVTHEIGFARNAADRIVVLADGKIVEEGPPGVVLDQPSHARTRQFLSAHVD